MYRSIVVIVAMESELVHLVPAGAVTRPLDDRVFDGVIWTNEATNIVVVRSGIGMVAAAAATDFAIRNWQADAVLNFGCTGAHVRDLHPGDVVVGSSAVAHSPGRIGPDGQEYFHVDDIGVGDDTAPPNVFPCDPELLSVAGEASANWRPERWPIGGATREPEIRIGPVGSGDVWNQHIARIERLHAMHGTLCEDMEAAAIAQIAQRHAVPFLTIKDISNNEFHHATDFGATGAHILSEELGKRAGTLLRRIVDRMVTT